MTKQTISRSRLNKIIYYKIRDKFQDGLIFPDYYRENK